jgi:hypothetical protein
LLREETQALEASHHGTGRDQDDGQVVESAWW